MTALFTKAMPFTVVSANQSATAPASNAGLDEPGMVWRTDNLTSPYVILDLGPNPSAYDTIAIVGSNLRAADTVWLRTGSTSAGTGGLDNGIRQAWSGSKPQGWTARSLYRLSLPRTDRYVRIDLAAPSHPDGYVEVSHIIVGKAITTIGIDIDAEQSIVDQSDITTVGGYDIIVEAPAHVGWKFSISWLDDASWRTEWLAFASDVRKVKPVLFVPNMDDPTTWQQDIVYGRFRNDPAAKSSSRLKRALDIKIEGMML